ncbi:MAG TPA: acyl-CoA dehydrogenase, partial [Acidimicrobiales bacterium]|nr:acyl-CoA dehydrogenase [Acidimicrobiales bacterium]
MPIGISEEHEALRQTARRWLESRCPPSVPRALLDAEEEGLPPFWAELAEQGWLGLHLPEEAGGQGYGLAELAVVAEELGRAVAPGPFLPTVAAGALLAEAAPAEGRSELLASLASGEAPAAVAWLAGALRAERSGEDLVLSGVLRPVLGGSLARLLVVPARLEGQEGATWCVVEAEACRVRALPSLDPTRRPAEVALEQVRVGPERVLVGLDSSRVGDLVAVLAAAEAAGGHAWCLDTASSYAKVREQFGRPIGQFQAVKHKLANMLVALEQSTAATWDAAQVASRGGAQASLAAAVAAGLALSGFAEAAKDCIQVLGGIGFTWEHDAHLYLKRAAALRQLLGGAPAWYRRAGELARSGTRRSLSEELMAGLPAEETERVRAEVAPELAEIAALAPERRRAAMAERGYIAPHWPRPWGRGAGPIEQLVIDGEMERAGLRRPNLGIGAWALPTIIAAGTERQQQRWVGPTLRGELSWCQLFSEPGAGSDLASLTTKASKVEGGWRISGQKVWTSLARQADLAICLARTNPAAPKHEGITYFIVDMKADGIEIRPLRELTGAAMFNEVFLSDVFVPDDWVIGEVDDGWRLART